MITALRGMKDILDDNGELYSKIIKTCEKVARAYGFSFVETPKMEETPLFRRSVGESSDIVGKEMYEFTDKGGTSVCLRPEGTAGVVRAFLEAKMDRAGAAKKWFYHGSMFRYERPQRGRLREFHQFGVESFGEGSVYEDAAVILMLNQILNELKIKTTLRINSLGDSECMPRYKGILTDFLAARKTQLCEDCQRRVATNPIRVLDCKNDACQAILADAPLIIDHLNAGCRADFEKLQSLLSAAGVEFVIDARLVRGLDYYCKTAFEFESSEIGAKAAVAGGGRYDRLVEFLGGRPTPAVGWAMGVERVMEILRAKECGQGGVKIYCCALNEVHLDAVFGVASQLRAAANDENSGIFSAKNMVIVEFSPAAKSPAKHLAAADKMGAEWFVCIGDDEAKNGELWLKNLKTKTEKRVKSADILEALNGENL